MIWSWDYCIRLVQRQCLVPSGSLLKRHKTAARVRIGRDRIRCIRRLILRRHIGRSVRCVHSSCRRNDDATDKYNESHWRRSLYGRRSDDMYTMTLTRWFVHEISLNVHSQSMFQFPFDPFLMPVGRTFMIVGPIAARRRPAVEPIVESKARYAIIIS